MFALDTNTVIHFFKGAGEVAEHLLSVPPAEVAVPSIVVFELRTGVLKSAAPEARKAQLDTFLASTTVLGFERAEADAAASVRRMLESQGVPIGPFDTLIAGTALANGATLVTRNVREFRRVDGLEVVSWYGDLR
jgi:tRNA(fMet)-specific endonuclease VapC